MRSACSTAASLACSRRIAATFAIPPDFGPTFQKGEIALRERRDDVRRIEVNEADDVVVGLQRHRYQALYGFRGDAVASKQGFFKLSVFY